jgi:hypothetical protein
LPLGSTSPIRHSPVSSRKRPAQAAHPLRWISAAVPTRKGGLRCVKLDLARLYARWSSFFPRIARRVGVLVFRQTASEAWNCVPPEVELGRGAPARRELARKHLHASLHPPLGDPCRSRSSLRFIALALDDGAFVVRAAVPRGHVDAGGPPLGAAAQRGYLFGIEAVRNRLQGHALVA